MRDSRKKGGECGIRTPLPDPGLREVSTYRLLAVRLFSWGQSRNYPKQACSQKVAVKWKGTRARREKTDCRLFYNFQTLHQPSSRAADWSIHCWWRFTDRPGSKFVYFHFIAKHNFVWPPDQKNDFYLAHEFLRLLLKTTVHNKILIFERVGVFHPNHDPRFSVGAWIFGSDEGILANWGFSQDNGNRLSLATSVMGWHS